MEPLILGSHLRMGQSGMLGAAKEMLDNNATSFMVYTRSNRSSIKPKRVETLQYTEANITLALSGLSLSSGMVHAPLSINIAGVDAIRRKGRDVLREEMQRTEKMGIPLLIVHPGTHGGKGENFGIGQVIKTLNEVVTGHENTTLCLETMAGDGSKLGSSFEQIRDILYGVDAFKRRSIGVCLHTSHVFAAGYDIVQDLSGVLRHFDDTIGLSFLQSVHVSDSKHPFGSRKDHHANIGAEDGYIPKESLRALCHHPSLYPLPMIVETPFGQHREEIAYLRGDDQVHLARFSLR